MLKNKNYDDTKRKRRFRRNLSAHKYPVNRKTDTPSLKNNKESMNIQKNNDNDSLSEENTDGTLSDDAVELLAPADLKMYNIKQIIRKGQKELLELDNERKKKFIIKPSTYKSTITTTLKDTNIKKKKPVDESWIENEKKVGIIRNKVMNETSSEEDSVSSDGDKISIRRKKKFLPTKESNSDRRKRIHIEIKEVNNDLVTTKKNILVPKQKKIGDKVTKSSDMNTKIKKLTNIITKSKDKTENKIIKKINTINDTWDIIVNKQKEWRIQNKKLFKVEEEASDVINHRKAKGYHGEMLVLYTTGQREWCYLHGVYQEIPDKVKTYMVLHHITLQIMGYEDDDEQLQLPTITGIDDGHQLTIQDSKINDDVNDETKNLLHDTEIIENGNLENNVEYNIVTDLN